MNNLSSSIKKFVGNKNTVTILGVLLCIVILYFGYNYRINQKVTKIRVPYANQTIQPKTKITADMISYMEVAQDFVGKNTSFYKSSDDIVGKYANYNTMIAEGSVFYTDLVTAETPTSKFEKVEEGYTLINYGVDMDSTYANSMMPGDYINIYFKGTDDDGTIMFGKFVSNIKIIDVKDSNGQGVFETTDEARTPAYMLFALPEDMHLLFRKALYLEKQYNVELILVPNTEALTKEPEAVMVSSEDIQNFINEKTKMVSVDEILSSTANKATTPDENTNNNETNQ